MTVVDLSISKKAELANHTDMLGDRIREEAKRFVKDFKTSWLNLGRHLYSIHEDKNFMVGDIINLKSIPSRNWA